MFLQCQWHPQGQLRAFQTKLSLLSKNTAVLALCHHKNDGWGGTCNLGLSEWFRASILNYKDVFKSILLVYSTHAAQNVWLLHFLEFTIKYHLRNNSIQLHCMHHWERIHSGNTFICCIAWKVKKRNSRRFPWRLHALKASMHLAVHNLPVCVKVSAI